MLQWSMSDHHHICISYSKDDIKGTTNENPELIYICLANPIQVLNLHGCFWRFSLCSSNDIFLYKWTKSMLVIGPQCKERKYSGVKTSTSIGNHKVNRDCPSSQPTTPRQTVWTPRPSMQHIPLGVYHTGGFNAMMHIALLCFFGCGHMTSLCAFMPYSYLFYSYFSDILFHCGPVC